jgi:hypothetical protein
VTLCIAAECEYEGKPAVALLADWRAQTGNLNNPELMTGSDDRYKLRELRKATVMLAGSHSKATELVALCKQAIRDFSESAIDHMDVDVAVTEFMGKLRQLAAKRKMDLVKTFVENSTGVPHAEFVRIPTDQHPEIWREIRHLNLEADILIACVVHEPIIVRLDRFGYAHWEHDYGTIGNGSEIARAMLCLQSWEPARHHLGIAHFRAQVPLEECLYRISEAHHAAHKANPSSVGSLSTTQVLTEKYRSSPTQDFTRCLDAAFRNKHRVPQIEHWEKDKLLFNFQSLATGALEPDVPGEL